MRNQPVYYRLIDNDEKVLHETSLLSSNSAPIKDKRRLLVATLIILLVASIGINIAFLVARLGNFLDLDDACIRHTTQFSTPILKDVKIKYETVQFNGSFFDETIYRRTPSPEVDKAWTDLGVNYRFVPIPEAEAEAYGIPAGRVKRARREGGGFFANVEGLHHLHCLNMLRQTLYFNADYYRDHKLGPFGNTEAIVKYHAGHCLDILRQQLMCVADVGLLSQVWVDDQNPFPDFNTEHKCRNFEDIRQWAEERQVSPESKAEVYPGDELLGEFP